MREAGQRWRADPSGWTRFSPSLHHLRRHSGEAVLFGSHMKSNSFTSSWDGWFIQTLAAAQHGGRLCSWWSAWRRQREAIRGGSAETRRRRFAALTNRELGERSLLWQISVCVLNKARRVKEAHSETRPVFSRLLLQLVVPSENKLTSAGDEDSSIYSAWSLTHYERYTTLSDCEVRVCGASSTLQLEVWLQGSSSSKFRLKKLEWPTRWRNLELTWILSLWPAVLHLHPFYQAERTNRGRTHSHVQD